MKGDETERDIVGAASTPSEAAAAIFFYRRGDATEPTSALKLADKLESSLDEDDMVIVRRGDLTINQPRNLVGRRVVWRHPDPDTTDTPRRYGVVTNALVKFDDVGELGIGERDDVRLVVPQAEADSAGRVRVTLPAATGGVDAFLSDGTESLAPSWQCDYLAHSSSVTAWDEGVDIDGALFEDGQVDMIEDDALRVLAAVHAHRTFAEGGDGPREGVTTPLQSNAPVDLIDVDGDRWTGTEPGSNEWGSASPGYVGDWTDTRARIVRRYGPVREVPRGEGTEDATS